MNLKQVDGKDLMRQYGVSSLTAKCLSYAKFSEEEIRELLNEDTTLMVSKAPCVREFCERIQQAKINHEKVFVAGDYDCDGICATAIMVDLLDRMGIERGYYIPNRETEGYGLSVDKVKLAREKGYSLIITVDNGVKCEESILLAHALGMEVIVTDHHEIEEKLPWDLLVHPTVLEEPFSTLCGAGVALVLSNALLSEVKRHVALAAIASIGDVMPLWKETRKIVKRGFAYINQNELPAISQLLKGKTCNWKTVAFDIVPKMNAVGRLSAEANVNTMVPFVLSKDPASIAHYASQLEALNEKRKKLSSAMAQKAMQVKEGKTIYLAYDENFREGISGLVAGKIANETNIPTIILSKNHGFYKGSARSIEGFDLFSFLSKYPDYTAFGGHTMAAGFSFREEDYDSFKEYIDFHAKEIELPKSQPEKDAVVIEEKELTLEAIQDLTRLEPYPLALKDVLFAVLHPSISDINVYDKITKYHCQTNHGGYDALVFAYKNISLPESIHTFYGKPSVNRFRNQITVQLEVEDAE